MVCMARTPITFICMMLLFAAITSGCWSTPTDYWAGVDTATETDTIITDGGECFEDDTDCVDAGT